MSENIKIKWQKCLIGRDECLYADIKSQMPDKLLDAIAYLQRIAEEIPENRRQGAELDIEIDGYGNDVYMSIQVSFKP